jgi:CheY-like chemotaxis protein
MKQLEVLLIEDNPGDAFMVRLVLAESQTSVKVHLARDGMEALLMLASESVRPDLIIVDLNLPNISGHQVMERFRQNEIPMVVFSSSWDEQDRRRSLALGAREFVRKPLGAKAYRDVVCRMVEKWALRRDDAQPKGSDPGQDIKPKSRRSRKYSTQTSS